MMLRVFRKKFGKSIAAFLLLTILTEIFAPLSAFALTSGPTAPEVSSFEPAGTTDMVDMFTGDFNYNIPLFDLPGPNGGYPFNLAYHAGPSMDQEASWVGLGWNVNPGSINREMRGIPDEYNGELGDRITTYMNMKDNWTVGVMVGVGYEPVGLDTKKGFKLGISIGVGASIFYNSYKGMGIGFDVGMQGSATGKSGKVGGGLGLNLSMNSQNGASLSPSLSLSSNLGSDKKGGNYGLGASVGMSFNSLRGLGDLNLTASLSYKRERSKNVTKFDKKKGEQVTKKVSTNIDVEMTTGAAISFNSTAFTPGMSMPMTGGNASITINLGPKAFYQYFTFTLNGNFSMQKLRDKKKDIKNPAYGYLNFEFDENRSEMVDFNREKDGAIRKQTTHIASPQLTYDIYNIQGQGVGGMFRPYRSDIGSVYDPSETSTTGGGGGGLDIGFSGTVKVGGNIHINVSEDFSGFNNGIDWGNESVAFEKKSGTDKSDYQSSYFRLFGEQTNEPNDYRMKNMGGDHVARVKLNDLASFDGNTIVDKQNNSLPFQKKRSDISYKNYGTTKRKPRLSVVTEYKNSELYDYVELKDGPFPEYNISGLDRRNLEQHHIGGFSVLGAGGSTHVYGLPVYNNEDVEMLYAYGMGSILKNDADINNLMFNDYKTITDNGVQNNTDELITRTTIDPYTVSHLLTSVLGADYVDIDGNGPSDNDFGHWIKFNYEKKSNYKWRAPFTGANYSKGLYSIIEDDKASYKYGEREMYMLSTVESKTHIAVFRVSKRRDAKGAEDEYQGTSSQDKLGAYSYKLDRIDVYTKSEYYDGGTINPNAKPLSSVHFQYDYSLCKNIENFFTGSISGVPHDVNDGNGKLTLKKVWFTYDRNTKGSLTPYEFNYSTVNPNYSRKDQDRWGNYKQYPTASTDQFARDHTYTTQDKNTADNNASAWNLSEVITPTGSKIKVSYESDDYAYVQNMRAAQMFKIKSFGLSQDDKIYESGDYYNAANNIIKIDISDPKYNGISADEFFKDMYKEPMTQRYQLYFKVRINMKKNDQSSRQYKEYVSGYAYVEGYEITGAGLNRKLEIKLAEPKFGKNFFEANPISMAAWQFLRSSLPQICNDPGPISGSPGSSSASVVTKMKSLATAFTSVAELFSNYYKQAKRREWAQFADLNNSFVRLTNPTMKKYGGGHRVKKLEITDEWNFDNTNNEDNTSSYGVVYKYALDKEGNQSSGVAQYEPITGGDEIALRHADFYFENVPIKGGNNMYYEYPINEAYFPAPVVGYSKVSVMSLASDQVLQGNLNTGVVASGETIHEFYTAKDFPVIADYTPLQDDVNRICKKHKIFIPFLGDESEEKITISQGYKIELNDMHGKQKAVTYYAYKPVDGSIDYNKPVSSVSYTYKSKPVFVNGNEARKLDNEVTVINPDETRQQMELGVESEMFHDTRATRSFAGSGGADIQVDMALFGFIPVPVPIPLPNLSFSDNIVRTIVTNKIIHRSGIVEKTTANDGESTVETQNMLYDNITGRVLLTKVMNNYNEPIYSYSTPAYWAYEKMGPAYRNVGYELSGVSCSTDNSLLKFQTNTETRYFVEGDILLVSGTSTYQVVRKDDANLYCSHLKGSQISVQNGTTATASLKVMKSGNKNLLEAEAGKLITLNTDPTINGSNQATCASTSSSIPNSTYRSYMPDYINDVFRFWNDGYAAFGNNLNQLRARRLPNSVLTSVKLPNATVAAVSSNEFLYFGDLGCSKTLTSEKSSLKYLNVEGKNHPNISGCEYGTFYDSDPCYSSVLSYILAAGETPEIETEVISETVDVPCCRLVLKDALGNPINIDKVRQFVLPATFLSNSNPIGKIDYYESNRVGLNAAGTKTAFIHLEVVGNNSNCNLNIEPIVEWDYDIRNCEGSRVPLFDNVLSATATSYNDVWPQTFNDLAFVGNAVRNGVTITPDALRNDGLTNPYLNGEKGLWRAEKSYVYVEERNKSPQVDTKKDGTFNDVPKFPWQNSLVFRQCEGLYKKWRMTNTITRYNNSSSESENKNILNIFSSALFGNNENLNALVASNANTDEVGVESFEELKDNVQYDRLTNSTTNLDFVNNLSNGSLQFLKPFEIKSGKQNLMEITTKLSELPINNYKIKVKGTTVAIGNKPAESFYFTFNNVYIPGFFQDPSNPNNPYNGKIRQIQIGDPDFNAFIGNRCWTGTLYIVKDENYDPITKTGFSYSSSHAHTGKKSLKIESSVIFPQWNLNLEAGKKYILSMWIKPELQNPTYEYKFLQSKVVIKSKTGTILSQANIERQGEVIEGWQKAQATFTVPVSDFRNIEIEFSPYSNAGTTSPLYVDDIRIHPFDANVKAFVYDPVKFRLASVLDENNYASYYYYNDEGELYLVKKETNKGVVTLQESRKNIPKR